MKSQNKPKSHSIISSIVYIIKNFFREERNESTNSKKIHSHIQCQSLLILFNHVFFLSIISWKRVGWDYPIRATSNLVSATPRRNIGVGWEWVKVNQRTFLFQTSRNANFRISYPCDGINAYMFAHIPPKVDCELVRRNYAGAFKGECMFRRETRCLLTNGCNDRWSSWISCPTFVICYLDWG